MTSDADRTAGIPAPQGRTLLFETDWVGSRPFYYNIMTGTASACVNDVIDFADLEVDAQGFNDYLEFGYTPGERTPVRDVRVLPPHSRLFREPDGSLLVERLPDPVRGRLDVRTREEDVIELLRARFAEWQAGTAGEIVIPTSGGLDSRLLNLLMTDRARVRAFTFGVSDHQDRCFEVVRAQVIARRLGVRWERIPLGAFHRYFDEWDDVFGPVVHAHGMYQMEFYDQIAGRTAPGATVVSGSAGDTLAGMDDAGLAEFTEDVPARLRDHASWGMHGDVSMSLLKGERPAWQELWGERSELAGDVRLLVVENLRAYMRLNWYLTRVPEAFGFATWAPFRELESALAMLGLPFERRRDRAWQRDLFRHEGLDLESEPIAAEWLNTLNLQGLRTVPLRPLDVGLLREVVRPDYVRWINRNVGRRGEPWEWYLRLGHTKGFRRVVHLLRGWGLEEQRRPAYVAYLMLRPIESLLRKRDAARAALAAGGAGSWREETPRSSAVEPVRRR
jgi:asparagine synthetase B (glutamine-hydrolysing)